MRTLGMKGWRTMALGLLLGAGAAAQIGGAGQIQGTVRDPSGAAVAQAQVTAVNQATGVRTAARTTSRGFYALAPLAPGRYTVTVSAVGFKTANQQKVKVNALENVGLNFQLQVGSVTQQVTVTTAPPRLDTTNGTLGATVPNRAYEALPLAVSGGPRNPTAFVTLLPGTNGAGGTLHANGGQGFTGSTYIDGAPDTFQELGNDNRGVALGIPVDAIQQFQLDTSGTPAMYEGQGVQNYVVKSGGNQFHGDLYEFNRNTVFDARSFFAKTRPIEKQNEFGGTLGGAIKKNKIFFFVSYDGYRENIGTNPSFVSLPTAAERKGDFSALLNTSKIITHDALGRPVYAGEIFDPSTTRTVNGTEVRDGFGFDPTTGLPIPGQANVIPGGDLTQISQTLQSYLPATVNNGVQSNFLASFPFTDNNNEFTTKEDFALSSSDRLWTVFNWGKRTYLGAPGNHMPLPYAEERQVNEEPWLAQIGDTYTLSPTLINQLELSYNRIAIPIKNVTVSGDYPTKAGLMGLPAGQASTAFPRVNFSGPNSPEHWGGNGAEAFDEFDNEASLTETLAWVHGAHQLNFGADMAKGSDVFFAPDQGSYPATFNFSNSSTAGFDSKGNVVTSVGNAYASYLLGDMTGASISYNAAAEVDSQSYRFGPFVEDDWQATRHLSLNLGLRWDIFTPFVERHNILTFFNPTLKNPVVGVPQSAGAARFSCGCRTPVKTHYNDFAPRLGFAYRMMKNTVLRGSWGMFYDRAGALGGGIDTQAANFPALGYSNGPIISAPNSYTPALSGWNGGTMPTFQAPPIYNNTLNTGFTTSTGPRAGGMTYADPQLGGQPVVTESYNLGIERELSPSTTLSIMYSGSQGHYIPTDGRGYYIDQILPKYLVLGSLLDKPANAGNIASANSILAAHGIAAVGLPYATFDGNIGQMLRPFPQYSGIGDPYGDVGNEVYNSLQIMAQRHFSRGLYFMASYTWSKDIGTGGSIKGGKGAGLGSTRTGYNIDQERAVCLCDIPDILTISEVWQLPMGAGYSLFNGNKVERALASGWEFSGIEHYQTGTPLGPPGAACNVPYAGSCYANLTPGFAASAVRINGSYGSGGDPAHTGYLNKAAFQNPAAYTFGDAPRTLAYGLRNPGYLDEDIALMRNFQIHEGVTFQVRGEAFNALNRVNFGGPNFNITSKAFGTIGSAGGPRIIQLSGKIVF